ncbi:MAG: efflux RND transporter periplasmic adaptor subunit [Gammaproteobacteria bacterium]|nr:efflux RND transporter periplasmic adaptor subunit [Gammaproteobacteria bacterium]
MRVQISRLTIIVVATLLLSLSAQIQAAEFEATLQWAKRAELGVPVSGVVHAVYADVGQKVAKGDKLLQLDDTVLKAAVKQAASNLKSQEEQYKEAEREKERAQNLYDRTVLSDHELQVAKNNEVKAAAERDHARAVLVKAQQNLRYSTLRAPFNALVLERHVQVGKVLAAELKPETLFIVADADQMLARIFVTEAQLSRFKLGQSAKVLIDGNSLNAVIKAIGFEPVGGGKEAGSYPVDVEFGRGDRMLRAGQHVKVDLP